MARACGMVTLNRTACPCYSQKHVNDSHLSTVIKKGVSSISYLLVKENADLRSESHSEFQHQGDIYCLLYPRLAFRKEL